MTIDVKVSLAVIALIAIAQVLMQLGAAYQQHAAWLGALSGALILVANKLPAAFERKPDPNAIALPPIDKGGAQ